MARPLKVLVPLIQNEIRQGQEAAEEAAKPFYQRAGELLVEAKSQLRHGEWEAWVKRNFNIAPRTAREWMQYVKGLPEYENGAHGADSSKPPTLSDITRPNRDYAAEYGSSRWQAPVREILTQKITPNFIDRIAQEEQAKRKELELMRKLATQLIDIGYKVLATKLHPDHGGSPEAMNRLNRVRGVLKDVQFY